MTPRRYPNHNQSDCAIRLLSARNTLRKKVINWLPETSGGTGELHSLFTQRALSSYSLTTLDILVSHMNVKSFSNLGNLGARWCRTFDGRGITRCPSNLDGSAAWGGSTACATRSAAAVSLIAQMLLCPPQPSVLVPWLPWLVTLLFESLGVWDSLTK